MEVSKQLFQKPVEYASFNRRLYSMTFDILFFIILTTPIMNLIGYFVIGENDIINITKGFQPQEIEQEIQLDQFLAALIEHNIFQKYLFMMFLMFVLLFIYEFFFWVKFDATPGKWLFSTKIVDADTLKSPKPIQYVKRYLYYFVSTIPFYIGFFAISWSPKKQAWHDRFSNVVVIVNNGNFQFLERLRERVKNSFSGKKA